MTSYMYDYINNRLYPGNPDVAKSYALRLLIHFLGDIHQPMHTESRFNDAYPEGDKGGNDFDIPYHYEADELHAVWDKGIYTLRGNIVRPFTNETYAAFQTKTVDPYMATYQYSLTDSTVANVDIDMWSWESNDLATGKSQADGKSIYDGVTENEVIPQAYIDRNVPILENNVTLGGYRLAYLTIYMYGSQAELDKFETTFLQ